MRLVEGVSFSTQSTLVNGNPIMVQGVRNFPSIVGSEIIP